MKIGILTFHRAHNYGAVLQAYALKTFLNAQGHDVSFVDYWPKWHADTYALWNVSAFKTASILVKIKMIIKFVLVYRRKKKRIDCFRDFMYNYLGLPPAVRYSEEDSVIAERYDIIIVGSDQVWRNWITPKSHIGFDPVYFADRFNRKQKCISYAASMGIVNCTAAEDGFLKRVLGNFCHISVREKTLHDKLLELGYTSDIVLDPVFLLSKEEWNNLLPLKRYSEERYVLFYKLLLSDDAEILAKRVADSLKCKLIIITGSIHTIQNFEEKSSVHPLVFLHILRDADFVVSTSFHGTAFSIIFEKQFYSIGLGQKSDRVKTMLDVMNMGDRYLCGNIDVIHIDSLINYSINKHYLEDSISFSRQWLEINTKACLENN